MPIIEFPRRRPVVLIADPSSGSRATMRIVLEHWFDVLDAANLDEARHILLARPVHVVLISAVMPPDADGRDLASNILERWPRIGIVVASRRREATDLPIGMAVLRLPWTSHSLLEAVHQSIAR